MARSNRCVMLRSPEGTTRFIPHNTPYTLTLGEVRLGSVDCPENGQIPVLPNKVQSRAQLLQELDVELGKGSGDWIKAFVHPVAKLVGKGKCSTCETRRVVSNAFAQLKSHYGTTKALSIIKDLWQLSFSKQDEEVLLKLRKYLKGESE